MKFLLLNKLMLHQAAREGGVNGFFDCRQNSPLQPQTTVDTTKEEGREMFYLTTHSTHFIYGNMALDIW